MSFARRLLLQAAVAILVAGHLPAWAVTPDPAMTPVQMAFLRAENRRVEDRFVQQVANVAGVREEAVRNALPARGRITDRLGRLFSALERDLKHPLSDEQKGRIFVAEEERKQGLHAAMEAARKR